MRTIFSRLALSLFAAVTLAFAGCMEESAGIPAKAVDAKTAGVVRFDVATVSVDAVKQSMVAIREIASKSTNPQSIQFAGLLGLQEMNLDVSLNPELAAYEKNRSELAGHGIREVFVLFGEKPEGDAQPVIRMLLRGESGKAEEVGACVNGLLAQADKAADEVSSDAIDLPNTATTTEIARGWYALVTDTPLPLQADAARASQLDGVLAPLGTTSIALGIVMPPDFEAKVKEALAQPEGLGPAAMFAGQFEASVSRMTSAAFAVEFGPNPVIQAQADFADDQAATSFTNSWNQTVGMLTGFMAMGAEPDQAEQVAKQAAALQTALSVKATGRVAAIRIDRTSWESILK